jgi:hypothetical protein
MKIDMFKLGYESGKKARKNYSEFGFASEKDFLEHERKIIEEEFENLKDLENKDFVTKQREFLKGIQTAIE